MSLSTKVSLFGSTSISTFGSSSSGGSGYGGSLVGGSSGSSLFAGYGYGTGLLGSSSGFGYGGSVPSSGGGGSSTPSTPQVGPQGVDIAKQVAEDGSLSFVGSDFAVSDGTALVSFKVTAVPTNGTLKLLGVAVAPNQVIAVADFANLSYEPDPDFDGVETFSIAMSTDGAVFDSSNSSVTITVLANDNDAPTINAVPTVAVEEGAQATNIGSLIVASFNDPDSSDSLGQVVINAPLPTNGDLSYTSAAGGVVTLAGAATITAAEAATLVFTADEDNTAGEGNSIANTISFDVIDSNGDASTSSGTVNLQITDGNDAPAFTSAVVSFSITENQTALTTPSPALNPATDNETPATLTYSITGTDAALFNVDSANGDLSFKTAPDYEDAQDSNKDNIHEFNLVVTDAGGKTATTAVTVTVADETSSLEVEVNGLTAALVADVDEGNSVALTASYQTDDSSNDVVFSLDGGVDDSLFTIDPSSGQLRFKSVPDADNPADTDTNGIYAVRIKVDDGTDTDTADVNITVNNIHDEAPAVTGAAVVGTAPTASVLVEGMLAVTMNETAAAAATATVLTLSYGNGEGGAPAVTPAAAAPSVTYSLSSDANTDNFSIGLTDGVISLKAAPTIDFEQDPTIQLTVTVTDMDDGTTSQTTVEVNLNDVDEDPEYTPVGVLQVDSDASLVIGNEIEGAFEDPEGANLTFNVALPQIAAAPATAKAVGVLTYHLNGVNGATVPITAPVTGLTANEVASIRFYGPETEEAHSPGAVTESVSVSLVAEIGITAIQDNVAALSNTATIEVTVKDVDVI